MVMIIINHGLGHPGLGIMVILVIMVQIFIKVIMVKQVDKGVHGHHHQPPPVSNGVDQAIKEVD